MCEKLMFPQAEYLILRCDNGIAVVMGEIYSGILVNVMIKCQGLALKFSKKNNQAECGRVRLDEIRIIKR